MHFGIPSSIEVGGDVDLIKTKPVQVIKTKLSLFFDIRNDVFVEHLLAVVPRFFVFMGCLGDYPLKNLASKAAFLVLAEETIWVILSRDFSVHDLSPQLK